jgi:NDP-sugar pyrophosphorylase family protein
MGVETASRCAIMMAQGSATRLSPGTWNRTKAVWPMVGTPMIRRITDHLYCPQGFTDVTIKTALFQDQIAQQFTAANMPDGMKIKICRGEENDRYLDRNNTAAGALLAYKQRWGIDSMCSMVGFHGSPALRDIASPRYTALKKLLKKPIKTESDQAKYNAARAEIDVFVSAAADSVRHLKPLPASNQTLPFLITGVDALTTANIKGLADFYLQASGDQHHSHALGAILIKEFPLEAKEQVKNYGVVLMSDSTVTGFEEKSSTPQQYKYTTPNKEKTIRSYLVNPQLYYFDPAVLGIVELLANYGSATGFSPDWGGDILPILAKSGQLLGQIMDEHEYWNDVGDYGTFLTTAQDILTQNVVIPVAGQAETPGHWNNGAAFTGAPGSPILEGNYYLGPKALISNTARVRNSVIESGAVIQGKVDGSVILEGATIPPQAEIINSIVHEGVILPSVSIYVKDEILVANGNGTILRAKIPYDDSGLPINDKPAMPTRANFPNR